MTTNINIHDHIKLFSTIERLATKGWRGVLESTRRMMGLYSKVLLCVFGRLTKGHCLAIYSMSKEIHRLYKKSGPLFTGMYLKQVSFLLMRYVGKDCEPLAMKIYVATTRTGLPTFIPLQYRKLIRSGNDPLVIQVVLTICTLSKIILVANKSSRNRIDSTTIYPRNFKLLKTSSTVCKLITVSTLALFKKNAPGFSEIPLNLGFTFRPSLSSGPNTYKNHLLETVSAINSSVRRYRLSVYHTLCLDAEAAFKLMRPVHLRQVGDMFFPERVVFARKSLKEKGISLIHDGSWNFLKLLTDLYTQSLDVWCRLLTRGENGRFGRKLEGAGKVRVFAIANPLFQALLRPLHDWAMQVLRLIGTDGTYNQLSPLLKLIGRKNLYSFDLKSATDLFPLDYSYCMLESLFGSELADAWRILMQNVSFRDPSIKGPCGNVRCLKFSRGQPLGYYSSWPIFTLTHHLLVWITAKRVYQVVDHFKGYALLGDDIVIADKNVACKYYEIFNGSQILISREKSLVSFNGTCEFAKRFIINNHTKDRKDLSPLSMRLIRLCSGHTCPFVFLKLGCSFFNSYRLRGAGYRVFSKIKVNPFEEVTVFKKLSLRWRRHWLSMFTESGLLPLPHELWLGFPEKGYLTCYELGLARFFILQKVKPKKLNEKSFDNLDHFWSKEEVKYTKEFILIPFVSLHLSYLLWYSKVYFNYQTTFRELLSPPVAPVKVERASDSDNFQRYGLLFKLWDFLRSAEIPLGISDNDFGKRARRDYIYMTDPVSVIVDRSLFADCFPSMAVASS